MKQFFMLTLLVSATSSLAGDWTKISALKFRGYHLQYGQIKLFFNYQQLTKNQIFSCKHKWIVEPVCDESQGEGKHVAKIDVKLSQNCGNLGETRSFYASTKSKRINVNLDDICQTRKIDEIHVNGKRII